MVETTNDLPLEEIDKLFENREFAKLRTIPGERLSQSKVIQDFFAKARIAARGTEADVMVVRENPLEAFCIKNAVRNTERTIHNPGISSEADRQNEAAQIIEEAQRLNIPLAKIPEPLLTLKQDFDEEAGRKKAHWILMEFIPGETLWRIILEKVIEKTPERELDGWGKKDLLDMNEEALSDVVFRIFNLGNIENPLKQLEVLLNRCKGDKFIKQEFFDALKNTIRILNENRFFHRDLHPRNLMLTDEDIWLIDFGYSVHDPKEEMIDPYEESKLGDDLSFTKDKGILVLLNDFIEVSDEDQAKEREAKLKIEYRSIEQTIEKLAKKQKSKILEIIEDSKAENANNSQLVESLFEDKVLKREVFSAITTNSIDKIELYVKITALVEFKQFKSTTATEKQFEGLIRKFNPNPDILLTSLKETLQLINPNE